MSKCLWCPDEAVRGEEFCVKHLEEWNDANVVKKEYTKEELCALKSS